MTPQEALALYAISNSRKISADAFIVDAVDYESALAAVTALQERYAVRIGKVMWLRESDTGRLEMTSDPGRAIWHPSKTVARSLAAIARAQFGGLTCRIVRRLETPPEVIEE